MFTTEFKGGVAIAVTKILLHVALVDIVGASEFSFRWVTYIHCNGGYEHMMSWR